MSINDYIKTSDEGQEKHVPDIDFEDCFCSEDLCVKIQVGRNVLHPSTATHSIKTIILYGVTNEDKLEQLTVFQLGDENTKPCIKTTVQRDKYKKLIATSYCNLHGLWAGERKV